MAEDLKVHFTHIDYTKGMETTAEERSHWQFVGLSREDTSRLLRDYGRALAEIARLTAALAEAEKKTRFAEETANIAIRSRIHCEDDATAREAEAREEEREALRRNIQSIREHHAPLEEGEALILDTLLDSAKVRARSQS